jgi:hypothetical protein
MPEDAEREEEEPENDEPELDLPETGDEPWAKTSSGDADDV